MEADYPAIAGQAEIRLDTVGTFLPGQIERSERVLGSFVRGTPVRYQQGFNPNLRGHINL
jgi:hypothetical protein